MKNQVTFQVPTGATPVAIAESGVSVLSVPVFPWNLVQSQVDRCRAAELDSVLICRFATGVVMPFTPAELLALLERLRNGERGIAAPIEVLEVEARFARIWFSTFITDADQSLYRLEPEGYEIERLAEASTVPLDAARFDIMATQASSLGLTVLPSNAFDSPRVVLTWRFVSEEQFRSGRHAVARTANEAHDPTVTFLYEEGALASTRGAGFYLAAPVDTAVRPRYTDPSNSLRTRVVMKEVLEQYIEPSPDATH